MGYPFVVDYSMASTGSGSNICASSGGSNSGGLEPLGSEDLLKEITVFGEDLEAYSLALPPVLCLCLCSLGQAAQHLCHYSLWPLCYHHVVLSTDCTPQSHESDRSLPSSSIWSHQEHRQHTPSSRCPLCWHTLATTTRG